MWCLLGRTGLHWRSLGSQRIVTCPPKNLTDCAQGHLSVLGHLCVPESELWETEPSKGLDSLYLRGCIQDKAFLLGLCLSSVPDMPVPCHAPCWSRPPDLTSVLASDLFHHCDVSGSLGCCLTLISVAWPPLLPLHVTEAMAQLLPSLTLGSSHSCCSLALNSWSLPSLFSNGKCFNSKASGFHRHSSRIAQIKWKESRKV